MIDAGFPEIETLAWWGVFAPKATPPDVIAKMEAGIRVALAEPANAKRLQETQQMTLKLGGPKEMDAFLQREIKFWGQVVRENNIRP